ncbi:MAG: AraC family transcriptional regulator [Candidatus Omnitrophica bacterium]|nr:AraC family transcriptional regulator [Candidatus Omnitrophota bacterium]
MIPLSLRATKPLELAWLSDVTESLKPASELCPIWVRHGTIYSGSPAPPPERHPYCGMGINLEGTVVTFVERQKAERLPGDIILVGPGVPHWSRITRYPLKFITVYFLPSVLIDLGPQSDGPEVLRRFTVKQTLSERLVRPPKVLRQRLTRWFEEIRDEFERKQFGREIRLRTLLMEQLVELLRWEQRMGRKLGKAEDTEWQPVSKIFRYLREHYTEPIYAENLARAVGVSESRLKILFNKAVGMSWVKYLQGYRIHRAAALLSEPGSNVTEAAFAVGFESLSHFNATFHSFMGVSPTIYQKRSRIPLDWDTRVDPLLQKGLTLPPLKS